MRAKKLGRHELLSWINSITQSDYPKIENLSDGVGLCQLFDAFYPNIANLNSLKLNSKNMEDWEKNFYILNEILGKIKSHKTIDPSKMSKSKFTQNFEFLQFVYDLFAKSFGDPTIKYSAYEKRLEILKFQFGNKATDVKKYLPTHLIPNDLILKMDKQKFFGGGIQTSENNYNSASNPKINNINEYNTIYKINESETLPSHLNSMVDKYKDFFSILKDDLKKTVDTNVLMSTEIHDIEEERQYYLDKINNVLNYCDKKRNSNKIKPETINLLDEMIKIIKHVPEDFK